MMADAIHNREDVIAHGPPGRTAEPEELKRVVKESMDRNWLLGGLLSDMRFKCIVIDPPWDQEKTGKRKVRPNQGTTLDYPTMTPGEIAALPIPKIAEDNAFLWLWVTNSRSKSSGRPIIQQGFDLLEHWGFRYNTTVTWSKGTGPCPFGPYQITTEHILFAYRGKFEIPKKSMGKMKTIFLTDPARHSEKPAVFYENVRNNFEGPRVDLFARRRHEGFYAWGNQVEDEVQEKLI